MRIGSSLCSRADKPTMPSGMLGYGNSLHNERLLRASIAGCGIPLKKLAAVDLDVIAELLREREKDCEKAGDTGGRLTQESTRQ
jgi:hypothetical protein